MAKLADSGLWIDLTRSRSPYPLKALVAAVLEDVEVHLAEPIIFEVLRFASPYESKMIRELFASIPVLAAPPDLWEKGVELGQVCRRSGVTAGALDLLIAAVAIHHDAEFITFDADFEGICDVSPLRLTRLERPV